MLRDRLWMNGVLGDKISFGHAVFEIIINSRCLLNSSLCSVYQRTELREGLEWLKFSMQACPTVTSGKSPYQGSQREFYKSQ